MPACVLWFRGVALAKPVQCFSISAALTALLLEKVSDKFGSFINQRVVKILWFKWIFFLWMHQCFRSYNGPFKCYFVNLMIHILCIGCWVFRPFGNWSICTTWYFWPSFNQWDFVWLMLNDFNTIRSKYSQHLFVLVPVWFITALFFCFGCL